MLGCAYIEEPNMNYYFEQVEPIDQALHGFDIDIFIAECDLSFQMMAEEDTQQEYQYLVNNLNTTLTITPFLNTP